jgi:glycosyltransferase involved in cell wall biosynthesis
LNYLGGLLRLRLAPTITHRPVIVGFSQERMDDNLRAYLGKIPFTQRFSSLYMKWLYFPFFDHHIANSEYTADELRSAALGHFVLRGTWIRPMGVNLDHFSPHRRRAELRRRLLQNVGASDDSVLLLYAGRLVPEKNLSLLFDLLGHLTKQKRGDYRMLVVGDGIEREMWERKCASELPGRTCFLEHIGDRNVLADLYANSDVFVHPNPREPFGIAPLEAMASGLPLVAPNRGGVTAYANPENAWIANADVESFANAVNDAASNRLVAAEKAVRALATARQFRWDVIAPSFFELYQELIRFQFGRAALPAAAFCSTPARGCEAALMRAASRAAMGTFQAWSKSPRNIRKRPPVAADAPGRS